MDKRSKQLKKMRHAQKKQESLNPAKPYENEIRRKILELKKLMVDPQKGEKDVVINQDGDLAILKKNGELEEMPTEVATMFLSTCDIIAKETAARALEEKGEKVAKMILKMFTCEDSLL